METAKGSSYRYLDDGSVQRFKKVENKTYEPQSLIVYVPNFEWVRENATPEMLEKLGDNSTSYHENLLQYVQNHGIGGGGQSYVIDSKGKKLETNDDVKKANGDIFISLGSQGTSHLVIPVSITPKIGFNTYDSRKYQDENTGEIMRERHLGNAVVRIIRKGEKFTGEVEE